MFSGWKLDFAATGPSYLIFTYQIKRLPTMKRKRIGTDHTEKDGRNNDSAHYHVLNLKLEPFKKPPDFSRPVI